MSEHRVVSMVVDTVYGNELSKFLNRLSEVVERSKKEDGCVDFELIVENGGSIDVIGWRPESDAELKNRLNYESYKKEEVEAQERKELERLKRKYEL